MKNVNFLSALLLLCLSAKAQQEKLPAPTNQEALSALQEVLPILNKYNLITNGKEWLLSEKEAVSAINEHNRTAEPENKILSIKSYKENYMLIPGLPPDPYRIYGDKWFDMQERITLAFLKEGGLLRQLKDLGNKVFKDGIWRFLTTQEAVSAINEHNRTSDPEKKILSTIFYRRNYRLIPGLPSYRQGYVERIKPQIIGWRGHSPLNRPHGNKVFIDGHWRFLTTQEAVSAINEHNRTSDPEKKILSTIFYHRNYRLIPGLPSYRQDYLERIKPQIIGWRGHAPLDRPRVNKVFTDGHWRFLTTKEAVSAINEYNRTANLENKILSTMSYRENCGLIPGLPQSPWSHYGLNQWKAMLAHIKADNFGHEERCVQFMRP